MLARLIVIACATVAGASLADAHGIAGNRFFVGTLTIDDPAVADEAILPGYTGLGHPSEAGNVLDNRINWSFVRLLTPTLQASIDSGWIHRSWSTAKASGFDTTDIGIKTGAGQFHTRLDADRRWHCLRLRSQSAHGTYNPHHSSIVMTLSGRWRS